MYARRLRALAVMLVLGCGGHKHGPSTNTNPNTLFVEIHADGSHDDALRSGAAIGLKKIPFAVSVDRGGEVELQVEVSSLDTKGEQTLCKIKILVLRLPQHDLLGIADGAARAGGTSDQAEYNCIEGVSAALVRGKVRTLLKRRLELKR